MGSKKSCTNILMVLLSSVRSWEFWLRQKFTDEMFGHVCGHFNAEIEYLQAWDSFRAVWAICSLVSFFSNRCNGLIWDCIFVYLIWKWDQNIKMNCSYKTALLENFHGHFLKLCLHLDVMFVLLWIMLNLIFKDPDLGPCWGTFSLFSPAQNLFYC